MQEVTDSISTLVPIFFSHAERHVAVVSHTCFDWLMPLLLSADKKPRRVKKPHHLDEFESGFDDEMEMSGLPRRSNIDRKRRLPPALEPTSDHFTAGCHCLS